MQANNLIHFNTHLKLYFPCSKIFQFTENHFLANIVIKSKLCVSVCVCAVCFQKHVLQPLF